MTKEKLEISLENSEVKILALSSEDEKRRKEFAKAFDWYDRTNEYGTTKKTLRTPTWTEIFVKLGKMLNKEVYLSLRERQDEMTTYFDEIHNRISLLEHPKKTDNA